MTAPSPHLEFELCYSPKAQIKKAGKWEEVPDRLEQLDPVPTLYRELRGDYKTVSEKATELNEIQLRASFLDYLFFPEVLTPAGEGVAE